MLAIKLSIYSAAKANLNQHSPAGQWWCAHLLFRASLLAPPNHQLGSAVPAPVNSSRWPPTLLCYNLQNNALCQLWQQKSTLCVCCSIRTSEWVCLHNTIHRTEDRSASYPPKLKHSLETSLMCTQSLTRSAIQSLCLSIKKRQWLPWQLSWAALWPEELQTQPKECQGAAGPVTHLSNFQHIPEASGFLKENTGLFCEHG